MSYHNAIQESISNPIGIDKVIEDICIKLGDLSWHQNIFRRAWKIYEPSGKKEAVKAKTYLKNSNYYDVLVNDNFASMSFVTIDSPEEYLDNIESDGWNNERKRDISIVFWVRLNKLSSFNYDYVYTEVLKRDVEKVLKQMDNLQIKKYYDEDYKQIFKGFDITQKDLQLMAYPNVGFRFECTAYYGGKLYDCE